MPSCRSNNFCSAVGSVMRRRRIWRPSVVGRTMSALCNVESSAIALIGVIGCTFSTPLADGLGTKLGLRCSRCLSVTHRDVTGARNEIAFARKGEEARIEADQVAIVFGDGRS